MNRRRAWIHAFAIGLASSMLAGCGSSWKDGSQVEVSEEAKAMIRDKREMLKARAASRAKANTKAKTVRRR